MENTNEKKFIVVNGYERKICKNKDEVRTFINEKLQNDLAPRLISRTEDSKDIKDYDDSIKNVKIINLVYLYCTIYQEAFTIYETNAEDNYPEKRIYDDIVWKKVKEVKSF